MLSHLPGAMYSNQKTAKGMVVEKERHASDYSGELLGAICVLLLLKAETRRQQAHACCKGYCDNLGVIFYCKNAEKQLKLGQCLDDLIRVCKAILKDLPMNVHFSHVRSHADKNIPYEHLTLAQRLKVDVDDMAQTRLITSMTTQGFIENHFPYEIVRVTNKDTTEKGIGDMSENLAQ